MTNIKNNQVGYLPTWKKTVTFVSDAPVDFVIRQSDTTIVYQGKATQQIYSEASDETTYVGDFSDFTKEGLFYITSDALGEGNYFTIADGVYDHLTDITKEFFYLQRCGCDLDKDRAGDFAHAACHTGIGHVYASDETMDVSGGWHDAGDYGRYIVPAAVTVAQLLMAGDYDAEEIRYELDWMLKMQRADGAVYHKATPANFCGFIMPEFEKEDMVISPISLTATADFAACMALASVYYADDTAYAATLADAAKKAYAAMKTMDLPGGFLNPEGVTTGEYGDPCDIDEQYWAAAEMYKVFGDAQYRADFEAIAKEKIYHGYGWEDMGTYGNIAYITCEREVDADLVAQIKDEMLALANSLLDNCNTDGYACSLGVEGYIWGSNFYACNNGIHLYDAYTLTGDAKYLDAARDQIHYVLGRNCNDVCYVSGIGNRPMVHPHHRPSGFLGKPMPGMLAGGPCDWLADEISAVVCDKTKPATCYADQTGSFSTNEVTLYWNSALVLLLALTQR